MTYIIIVHYNINMLITIKISFISKGLITAGPSGRLSYAVPVNTIRRSVSQIVRPNRLVQGAIGVYIMPDQETKYLLPDSVEYGVIIHYVHPNSGAFEAGLRYAYQTFFSAKRSVLSPRKRIICITLNIFGSKHPVSSHSKNRSTDAFV